MPPRFTLGKDERLKRRKVIDRLFREGKSMAVFPFRVQFMFDETLPHPVQAGFSASSRQFKRAVDRNRIKRLIREAYRLQKYPLQEALQQTQRHLVLFFIYTGKELPAYTLVYEKMTAALKRLTNLVHESAASTT